MDKNTAIRIMQFLDKVATTGHKERMEMNACVDALVQIANQAPPEGGKEKPPGKPQLPPRRPRKTVAKKAATKKGK